MSCRPAPTLAEVADRAVPVDLAWTSGPLRFRGFGFSKSHGDLSEDAFAGNTRTASIAVADGASSSWQAGEWALHLCNSWVGHNGAWSRDEHRARVPEVQESFREASATEGSGPNQWFADEVARRGAYAAFLGVAFSIAAGPTVAYRALSVGDVCLLHYRKGDLLSAFPLAAASEFTSQPDLIASRPEATAISTAESSGELRQGEVLILATDGVASLLLREDVDISVVQTLTHGDADQIREALHESRIAGDVPDDDYTLVRITL